MIEIITKIVKIYDNIWNTKEINSHFIWHKANQYSCSVKVTCDVELPFRACKVHSNLFASHLKIIVCTFTEIIYLAICNFPPLSFFLVLALFNEFPAWKPTKQIKRPTLQEENKNKIEPENE